METGMAAKSRWSDDYNLEIMRSKWNSTVARLHDTGESSGRMDQRRAMPASVAGVDVDAFLRVMAAARH